MKKSNLLKLICLILITLGSASISFTLVILGVHTSEVFTSIGAIDKDMAIHLFIFSNHLFVFGCIGILLTCSNVIKRRWKRKSIRMNFLYDVLGVVGIVVTTNIIAFYVFLEKDMIFYIYSSGILGITTFILTAHHGDVIANNYTISNLKV